MKFQITWIYPGRTVTQVKELTNCTHGKDLFFTMNSPIYKAIEDGSFVIDKGEFGKHPFTIKEL